jgi:hypothetical protein
MFFFILLGLFNLWYYSSQSLKNAGASLRSLFVYTVAVGDDLLPSKRTADSFGYPDVQSG